MTEQPNNFFGIMVRSNTNFTICARPFNSGSILETPVVENVNREDLRVLRSIIDQALNTSAEELEASGE